MSTPRKPYHNMDMVHVVEYLKHGTYPASFTEGEKRNLRKRTKSFTLKDDQLYYMNKPKKVGSLVLKRDDRLVLSSYEDQIKVIAAAHVDGEGNHIGREKVTALVSKKYYWIGISSMVREYSQGCPVCQAAQANKSSILSSPHVTILSRPLPTKYKDDELSVMETSSVSSSTTDLTEALDAKLKTDWPFSSDIEPISVCFWDVVEMSVLGPYDSTNGPKYIVTFLDVFSCWVETVIVDLISPSIMTHLLLNLISRFGVMKTFTLKDIGDFSTLSCLPLSAMLKSTANIDVNVQGQSTFNTSVQWKEVRDALSNFIANNEHWEHCLEFALLPLRISRGQKADYTPAFLTYGRELNLPNTLSHRSESSTQCDPQLTNEQMKQTSSMLVNLYNSCQTDILVDEMSTVDKNVNNLLNVKMEKSADFRVPEVRRSLRGRIKKKTFNDFDTGKGDDDEVKEDLDDDDDVVDRDYTINTDETIMSTRSSKRRRLTKSPKPKEHSLDISFDSVKCKSEDGDGTLEHSYAGSPQENMGIHKFYSAICLYKQEKHYPPKSSEHFKRAIRQAAKKYKMVGDGLVYVAGGVAKKVPVTMEERMALLKSAHIDKNGQHRSKSQMLTTLCKHTWRGISIDCEAYLRACSDCNHGRDSSTVMRSPSKDEKVAEIAEGNHDLLVQYLKKNKLPGKCSKQEQLMIKKIAHLFKYENGLVYLKETKVAPARCLELTTRSRKTAIKKGCTNLATSEPNQEDLYREVVKHHIWNGMKKDITKYVKDHGGHLSEDVEELTHEPCKSVKQILSRVEQFKQYFKSLTDKKVDDTESDNPIKDKPEKQGSSESKAVGTTVTETKEPKSTSDTEIKDQTPGPSKKVFLVSKTRTTMSNHDDTPVTIHIEELDSHTGELRTEKTDGGDKEKLVSFTEADAIESNSEVGKVSISDSSRDYESISQTIVSDPVTAAAVKSILDIGPETLSRANRASQQPQIAESCVARGDSRVIIDLQTAKTIGLSEKTGIDDTQSIAEQETTYEILIQDVKFENDETATDDREEESVQETADHSSAEEGDGDKKVGGNHALFTCNICNKVIRGNIKYKMHMYQHTGVKPFKCDHCNKHFTTPKSKKLHMRKHMGFSPYLCNICGKNFSLNGSLRAHIKIHEKGGNVIVHCKICDRNFASQNRYDRHMKFKHPANPPVYKCDECNKPFTTLRAKKRHHMSHHLQVKCHLCGVCGRQFYRKEYLTSHMLQHSLPGEPPAPKRQRRPTIKKVQIMKMDEVSEPEQLSPSLDSAPVIEEVVMESFDVPQEDSGSATVQEVANVYSGNEVQVENTFYAIHTHDGDQEMEETVVYGYPAVQYEVECTSASELESEALSAINLLAQASVSQGTETVTYVTDAY